MDQTLIDYLLQNTYTKTDALRRIVVLKEYLEKKLFTKPQPNNILGSFSDIENFPKVDALDLNWLKTLDKNILGQFTVDNINQKIDAVESQIKNIMALIIYIPFELPPADLINIAQYIRQNYSKNFLIEVKLNPELIGGCAFVWNNIYKDYSIRQKILDNKDEILKNIQLSLKK